MNKRLFALAPLLILTALLRTPETLAQSWANLGSGMNNYLNMFVFSTNGDIYDG